MVAKAIELATRINVRWSRNPLEIETIATFGGYMSRDSEIADVGLGIVLRVRPPARRVTLPDDRAPRPKAPGRSRARSPR